MFKALIAILALIFPWTIHSLPKGWEVIEGNARCEEGPGILKIYVDGNALITFDEFSVAHTEVVQIIQSRPETVLICRSESPILIDGIVVGHESLALSSSSIKHNGTITVKNVTIFTKPLSIEEYFESCEKQQQEEEQLRTRLFSALISIDVFYGDSVMRGYYPFFRRKERLGLATGEGYILTSRDVVHAKRVVVMFPKAGATLAEIEKKDFTSATALLKFEHGPELPFLKIGKGDELQQGETVYLIGGTRENKLAFICRKAVITSVSPGIRFQEVSRTYRGRNKEPLSLYFNLSPSASFMCNMKGEVVGFVPDEENENQAICLQ